ncbi:hypothetical protein NQ317_016169 [Molorchus minor]|uniref:Paramyosin n=1 Tax=Molorchus minor TaxID=1323400 RepID=A0ABQ9JSD8_9CUCU|nr:hypothetical protein NQ317_016169 [Molorchus minor]
MTSLTVETPLLSLPRRLHELELELRRLENERDELTAAYKEAEAGRKAEEQRAQRLSVELTQFRHEAEKRLQEKDEEIEAIRQKIKVEKRISHLSWTNELGFDQYDPLKIKSYSHEDLSRISRKTEASIKAKLRDFKSTASSSFVLSKSVSAASITQKKKEDHPKRPEKFKDKNVRRTGRLPNEKDREIEEELRASQKYLRGKSAKAIERQLLSESKRTIAKNIEKDVTESQMQQLCRSSYKIRRHVVTMDDRMQNQLEESFTEPLDTLSAELKCFDRRSTHLFIDQSKATSIEIEQLNARVVEAETRLKTEVTRIKKKLQIQITELEMSLDSANKVNIDLQKTIKKQSLQLTEIQAHYDELQRQLQVTLDQLSVSQRRALRGKRQAEQLYEEAGTRINELTTINVNLSSAKSKIEQELSCVVADYDEITKELRISDERYQRVQILHEEQERVVKIEAIKKSLEIEVKNLSVRLEEVEANAIVGGKRIISKLEARLRDYEAELDEEKRRHAETIKILRKRNVQSRKS